VLTTCRACAIVCVGDAGDDVLYVQQYKDSSGGDGVDDTLAVLRARNTPASLVFELSRARVRAIAFE
jgi:hypothetical protein